MSLIINPYSFTPSTYDGMVSSLSPQLWWKMEETSGTSAADSSGNGFGGTLQGGSTFATAGVSVGPESGYSGIGKGVDFSVANTDRIQSSDNTALDDGFNSSDSWTLIVWVAGSSTASQYIANRQNDMAVIYQFVSDTVEFFVASFGGSDPRPGSGISLAAADTTTPHMIVYRYANGTWSGFKDGVSVFSVSRSFSCNVGVQHWNLGAANASNPSSSRIFDFAVIKTAVSDADILALYNAMDSA